MRVVGIQYMVMIIASRNGFFEYVDLNNYNIIVMKCAEYSPEQQHYGLVPPVTYTT
jgi:hypothetical protein